MGIEIKNRLEDLGFKIVVFLDNFPKYRVIDEVKVIKPEQLKIENLNIELVINTVVGNHYNEIEKQMSKFNNDIQLISVRKLVD